MKISDKEQELKVVKHQKKMELLMQKTHSHNSDIFNDYDSKFSAFSSCKN